MTRTWRFVKTFVGILLALFAVIALAPDAAAAIAWAVTTFGAIPVSLTAGLILGGVSVWAFVHARAAPPT